MSNAKYFLLLKDDSSEMNRWPLQLNKSYKLGRCQEGVDFPVLHTSVSRVHCELEAKLKHGNFEILFKDLKSANGSFHEGKILEPDQVYHLKLNDKVIIGDCDRYLQFIKEEIKENDMSKKKSSKKEKDHKHHKHDNKKDSKSKHHSKRKRSSSRSRSRERDYRAKSFSKKNAQLQSKRNALWGNTENKTDIPNDVWMNADFQDKKKTKFLKLIGANPNVISAQKANEDIRDDSRMNTELEKQYESGLLRKDGRKVGLGFF